MIELESWLDIEDYEGYYQVSNLGKVRSIDRGMYVRQDRYKSPRWTVRKGRILKDYNDSKGYRMVILCMLGSTKTVNVHRLVATHFIPNPESKPAVNHKNSNHLDNRASNLEWCTIAENNAHARAAGRQNHRRKALQ